MLQPHCGLHNEIILSICTVWTSCSYMRGQHSGALISDVASQQEGSGFESAAHMRNLLTYWEERDFLLANYMQIETDVFIRIYSKSIIIYLLSKSQQQPYKQMSRPPSPNHLLQLFWGETEMFLNQDRDLSSPVYAGHSSVSSQLDIRSLTYEAFSHILSHLIWLLNWGSSTQSPCWVTKPRPPISA